MSGYFLPFLQFSKSNKMQKTNPFENSIPFYLETKEMENFAKWLQTPLSEAEDYKHIAQVIYDNPGMGKTTAVAHYSRHGYYVPLNVNHLENLNNKVRTLHEILPDEIPLELLKGKYEAVFSVYSNNLLYDLSKEIKKMSPDEFYVQLDDVLLESKRPLTPGSYLDDNERNIILHFDEIQDWAGDLHYTTLNATDMISKEQFSSLRISGFVKALSNTIASLNYKRIKVVLTGTNCDINKHLMFSSSLIPKETTLPRFNDENVEVILSKFLTEKTVTDIKATKICQKLSGRPRNIQYFLYCLFDTPHESLEFALDSAFEKYKAEHDKFGGLTSRDAVFDSIVALIFYRSLSGTKTGEEIVFPPGSISENVRKLSRVGLLRIRTDPKGDVLYMPYPWLLDYLKHNSNHINIENYKQLLDAAGIIRSNALTGIGVMFQVTLAIEFLLPSSQIFQIIANKSGININPKLFDELISFTKFKDIHIQFERKVSSIFIIQDTPANDQKRYVDICCQVNGTKMGKECDVCLRIEAKNYNSERNDSEISTACLSFFEHCETDIRSDITYINAFICAKSFYSNLTKNSKERRQLDSFINKKDERQTYIIIENFLTNEGLVLPFAKLCDVKVHIKGNWNDNLEFSHLKNIFFPKIVIKDLSPADQQNIKAFLKRKYPNVSKFQGFNAKGNFVFQLNRVDSYENLKALLEGIGVVKLVPN
eukprot:NODE_137_length_16306_cov_0.462640.p2 type:complete len:708 gc:universal NODE_137_length_16306_cov_0.462640:13949-11826(-)